MILSAPDPSPYRFFDASREARDLTKALTTTLQTEIPEQMAYLDGYDSSLRGIEEVYDLPKSDASKLVRMIAGNDGHLSKRKRKDYHWIPDETIREIENITRESFAKARQHHARKQLIMDAISETGMPDPPQNLDNDPSYGAGFSNLED